MESEDETVEIARQFTDIIISHPRIANFDRARNVSALRARYQWIFYLDADDRAPPALGRHLRLLLLTTQIPPPSEGGGQGEVPPPSSFSAMQLPFRHHFAGRWMQCLYPGYKAPSIFANGKFHYH